MLATISLDTSPPLDKPSITSAPSRASANSPGSLSCAYGALNSFSSPASKRFLVTIPFESTIVMLDCLTPTAT